MNFVHNSVRLSIHAKREYSIYSSIGRGSRFIVECNQVFKSMSCLKENTLRCVAQPREGWRHLFEPEMEGGLIGECRQPDPEGRGGTPTNDNHLVSLCCFFLTDRRVLAGSREKWRRVLEQIRHR